MTTPEFKPKQIVKAIVPYCLPVPQKIHIDHILPSFYKGHTLIIYRVWKRNKPWWHEFMCTDDQMKFYIEMAQKHIKNKKS